ncbi:MAG TPA: hypothetical protein VK174_06935, partial [Chitinophagales bacterium]|nr:hypothetical protein [Chitinophagales bacterium]
NKTEIRLHHLTADLRLLYDKGLHEQGKKLIDKAYAEAEANEQLPFMITLCQFKDRFSRYRQTDEEREQSEQSFEKEKELLKMLEAERSIAHLRRQIFNLYITGKLKPEIPGFKLELAELETKTHDIQRTTSFRRSYIVCNALIAEKEGDYAGAMQWHEQLMEIAEKQSKDNREPVEYMRTLLSNFLVCAHHCERYELFAGIIKRIEEQPAPSPRDKAEIFIHTYQYRLLYHLNVPNTTGGEEVVQAIEKGLKKYHALIAPKIEINLRMNICIFLLQRKKFDLLINALSNAYNLLGRDEKYLRLLRDLKFMELMANTSLGNFDLLDYQLRNIDRWLKQHTLNNTYTEALIAFFKSCQHAGSIKNKSGQLATADCPPEMMMLRELVNAWLARQGFL